MNIYVSIFFIYLGSLCYTFASFYHLTLKNKWTFRSAYFIALTFVAVEYIFNVYGNKNANNYITVLDIMILIICFDLINLYIFNTFLLHNDINIKKIDMDRFGPKIGYLSQSIDIIDGSVAENISRFDLLF